MTAENEERVLSLVSLLTKIEDDLRAVLQQMRENRSKGHELYNQAHISANDKDTDVVTRSTDESSKIVLSGDDSGKKDNTRKGYKRKKGVRNRLNQRHKMDNCISCIAISLCQQHGVG